MRPITKWRHYDLAINPPIKEFYNPYGDAKSDLERNIDGYCCFCERPAKDEAAQVEHVQPKGLAKYEHLKYSWDNFLLACARCNGADNKSDKDVIFSDIHLPHKNNTLISINYLEGGLVVINSNLKNKEQSNAQALIDLVGLDKRPGHPNHSNKDKRWSRRREAWELATRYLRLFQKEQVQIDIIVDLAKATGFFSIWFTVFAHHSNIRQNLISSFKGTTVDCFDINCLPIARNPLNEEDTI
jgi:uncharacterized protein (TIGR02646 family)